ncbi:MAG: helix-turn-helix transcriptional regulator [Clostridia bacterium]|nr:helix-turn-helix transcriptional regulator [Clostridia bacterium]
MELNIGTNIKRLRQAKGLTQEQLAGLLSVSTAAVSKWEAKNTYPDITLLFPLASIFGVSVDELIGYDESKEKEDIDNILSDYRKYSLSEEWAKREKLLRNARKKYPHNYRIMDLYMWDLAGGSAANDPEVLLQNKEELTQLCDCILDGCTQDGLRANAINLKAKLIHADGRTEEAIELLSTLPAWHAPMVTEQLFAKDTAEFRYWNKRNCYQALGTFSNKFARITKFDPTLSIAEKLERLENLAQLFADLSEKPGMEVFCVAEEEILVSAATMLTADNTDIQNVIRVREKEIAADRKIMRLAENDEVLKEELDRTYQTYSPVEYLIHRLATSNYPHLAKLREFPEYMAMLERYR